MTDVHGVADLPDAPAPGRSDERANDVVPTWFGAYDSVGSTDSRFSVSTIKLEFHRAELRVTRGDDLVGNYDLFPVAEVPAAGFFGRLWDDVMLWME